MKVGVVGAGAVGAACVMSLVLRGSAREIVLVNRDRKRAQGVITDVQYGATLCPPVDLRAGDYAELAGAALVMVTVGVNEKSGGATDRNDPAGRLRLLDSNVEIYRQVIPQISRAAPDSVLLVVSDPPDPLADAARMLGHKRVLSTGTYLDSLRFRLHLARRFRVSADFVEAQVLGEHGTSSVFLWSSARVGGMPALEMAAGDAKGREDFRREIDREVRYANITIIEGTGASQYGIGMVSARIAEMVLRDEGAAIPIGSYNADYRVTLSLPSVIGKNGVCRILTPEMSDEEKQDLQRSAETLKQAVGRIQL